MGLPVVVNTPANNLISSSTSGTQSRTPGTGETAIVCGVTTVGGLGVSVTGAGATWTQIGAWSDGTRTVFIYRGSNVTSGSSQTVTVSFSNTTTCRWTWVAATGIDSTTPDDQNGNKTTASGTRSSFDCVSTPVTTPANVLCIAGLAFSTAPAQINGITNWTTITAGSGTAFFLGYRTTSAGLSSDSVSLSTNSVTASSQSGFASFNGDPQGGGSSTGRNLLTLGVG